MFTIFLSPTKHVVHSLLALMSWWLTINKWTVKTQRSGYCCRRDRVQKSFITVLLIRSLSAHPKKTLCGCNSRQTRRRSQMSHSVATFIISSCRLLLIKTLNILCMKSDEFYDLLLLNVSLVHMWWRMWYTGKKTKRQRDLLAMRKELFLRFNLLQRANFVVKLLITFECLQKV